MRSKIKNDKEKKELSKA